MSQLTPWIAKASDVTLINERDANLRWLALPYAEKWAEEFAERSAEVAAINRELVRRRDARLAA
jgi:hypothetical protein